MRVGSFAVRVLFLLTAFTVLCTSQITASAYNFTPVKGVDENENYIKLTLNSESAYMINMDSGDVVIDIKSKEKRVPASLTKIMTCVVVLDEFEGDTDKLKNTYYSAGEAAFEELYGTGASTANIEPDERVNVYDLLCALMLPSACEAANILAYGMCGSVEVFCDKMNETAERIGMEDSHFSNAHGLWTEGNYTTCQDLTKLCMYAINTYDVFREIVAMNSYDMAPTNVHPEGIEIENTNFMLNVTTQYYYDGCYGIKTGTLDEAGRCLASYAIYDGARYLIVTMGAPMEKKEEDIKKGIEDPNSVYAADTVYYNLIDHINLYEWAFSFLQERELVDKSSELREAKVEYGENGRDYVTLKPEHGYKLICPVYINDDEIEQEIEVYDNVIAPVYKGDELGMLKLYFQGEKVADIPLIATESVARSRSAELLAIVKSFPRSKAFKISMAIVVVGIASYVVLYVVWIQNKYMKKKRK